MERYLLFSGDNYYPNGGMNDFVDGFNNKQELEESFEYIKNKLMDSDWFNIGNLEDGTLVEGCFERYEHDDDEYFLETLLEAFESDRWE